MDFGCRNRPEMGLGGDPAAGRNCRPRALLGRGDVSVAHLHSFWAHFRLAMGMEGAGAGTRGVRENWGWGGVWGGSV